LEEHDKETFEKIDEEIEAGDMIFFVVENDVALATCMTIPMEGTTWEICKLGSNKNIPHKGAGSAVFEEAMKWALNHGAERLFILSNSKLKPALHIYEKYGFYKEGQISIVLKGADGAEQIKAKMEKMRANAPKNLASFDVLEVRDYQKHTIVKNNGEQFETDLPTSNVLYYELNNNSWCCVRPSGTEPKIKFYMGVKGESEAEAEAKLQELTEAMKNFVE